MEVIEMKAGRKMREVELVIDPMYSKGEYLVIGGWRRWYLYDRFMEKAGVRKDEIWNYRQNIPDLIVDDILDLFKEKGIEPDEELGNRLYAILLKRGVNKWFFVRMLLVRYKKYVKEKYKESKKKKDEYWKGYSDAMKEVRQDLKTMCNMPRWVIWNGSNVGLIWDKKIGKKIDFIKKILEIRFDK